MTAVKEKEKKIPLRRSHSCFIIRPLWRHAIAVVVCDTFFLYPRPPVQSQCLPGHLLPLPASRPHLRVSPKLQTTSQSHLLGNGSCIGVTRPGLFSHGWSFVRSCTTLQIKSTVRHLYPAFTSRRQYGNSWNLTRANTPCLQSQRSSSPPAAAIALQYNKLVLSKWRPIRRWLLPRLRSPRGYGNRCWQGGKTRSAIKRRACGGRLQSWGKMAKRRH